YLCALRGAAAMSDARESRQNAPFPAEAVPPVVQADALAGDWSEGLRGAVRALGIPDPRLLQIEHIPPPPPRPLPVRAPVAEMVEAPDAWAAAGEEPLQSQPPPPAPMPEATQRLFAGGGPGIGRLDHF